jgi:hypothetical protein
MFYTALSLSFTAGGIILLYLLWHVAPVEGQTLALDRTAQACLPEWNPTEDEPGYTDLGSRCRDVREARQAWL